MFKKFFQAGVPVFFFQKSPRAGKRVGFSSNFASKSLNFATFQNPRAEIAPKWAKKKHCGVQSSSVEKLIIYTLISLITIKKKKKRF